MLALKRVRRWSGRVNANSPIQPLPTNTCTGARLPHVWRAASRYWDRASGEGYGSNVLAAVAIKGRGD